MTMRENKQILDKNSQVLDEKGQTSIEFALTMILFFAFAMFYIRFALVIAFGNYAHYATFMAARAYFAAGMDDTDQQTRAHNVIAQLLRKSQGQSSDKFPFIAKSVDSGSPSAQKLSEGVEIGQGAVFNPAARDLSWQEGVRYTFRSKFFMTVIGGSAASSVLTLTSESWLGREPSYTECEDFVSARGGIIDNGC